MNWIGGSPPPTPTLSTARPPISDMPSCEARALVVLTGAEREQVDAAVDGVDSVLAAARQVHDAVAGADQGGSPALPGDAGPGERVEDLLRAAVLMGGIDHPPGGISIRRTPIVSLPAASPEHRPPAAQVPRRNRASTRRRSV